MKRQQIEQLFPTQTHFSSVQLRQFSPSLSRQHLDYRRKTGKIDQIKKWRYRINGRTHQEEDLREIANHIYEPSYVSLETALRYYNFIPEIVPSITSVSTKKTQSFIGEVGTFRYHRLHPSRFWGYQLIKYQWRPILIAEPEKALLDYLYYHTEMDETAAFAERRIDIPQVRETIDLQKFSAYSLQFDQQALQQRAQAFITYIYHDAA